MKNMVVAFPEIDPSSIKWIQEFRRKHDTHFETLNPHFTLVFPDGGTDLDTLIRSVRKIAATNRPISIKIRSALFMPRAYDGDLNYVFLIPDEGMGSIIRLHDALYTGSLQTRLRLDIPYVPHITIGMSKNTYLCKELVNKLNEHSFEVSAEIRELTVMEEVSGDWYEREVLKLSGS